MSIEMIYGLEMFWPVGFPEEEDWERYASGQIPSVASIVAILPSILTPQKLKASDLDSAIDTSALKWMYAGLWNASAPTLNSSLTPDELIDLYVGVWRFKELRDVRGYSFPSQGFEERVPYLMGIGRNNLGQDHRKKYLAGSAPEHLDQRLSLLLAEDKAAFLRSLDEHLKVPGRDFFAPESRIRPGLDSTARKSYIASIISMLYV